MPLIQYIPRKFSPAKVALIKQANTIIGEYQAQGYELTLRQLYYQFVARGLIENTMKSYKNLGNVVNDGRLAGLIDWEAIVDRTRNLQRNSHWNSPKEIVETAARSYQIDKWAGQLNRVEVWIEKDALIGVIENVCRKNDVPYFSCRGYTSQSELWAAGQRFNNYQREFGQDPIVIHLGDHDPSGRDMTRDIADRLKLFTGNHVEVNRIALNMNQISKYKPPPNPVKKTDKRWKKYVKETGVNESWELDALEPQVIETLIQQTIDAYKDEAIYQEQIDREDEHKRRLRKAAKALAD